ncbi:MAG: HD domain-containing protein [Actinomycetota bacterium]|nr:HD domain-containing protein [Actinomycetota bacterium]
MEARLTELGELSSVAAWPSVDRAVSAVRDLLGFDVVFATEITETHQIYTVLRGDGESFGVYEGFEMPIEATYCTRILAGDLPAIIGDLANHPEAARLPITDEAGVGAFASVPLILSDGRIFGTLCAASHSPMPELGTRDEQFLQVFARIIADQIELEHSEAERRDLAVRASAAQALIAAVGIRDAYTAEHSRAVVETAREVARRLGCGVETIESAGQVALLHDIGKLVIPRRILRKPARLTHEEWEVMRTHPEIGAEMIAKVPDLAHLTPAIRAEHERWDGSGYPDGLRGAEIPIESRITLACDAYDAMTTDRPYRSAISEAEARKELQRNAGGQFDPMVVATLMAILDERDRADGG